MIPTIGLMIGAYIVLRCVEILSRPAGTYSSRTWQSATNVLAMLTAVLSVWSCYELIAQGERISRLTP